MSAKKKTADSIAENAFSVFFTSPSDPAPQEEVAPMIKGKQPDQEVRENIPAGEQRSINISAADLVREKREKLTERITLKLQPSMYHKLESLTGSAGMGDFVRRLIEMFLEAYRTGGKNAILNFNQTGETHADEVQRDQPVSTSQGVTIGEILFKEQVEPFSSTLTILLTPTSNRELVEIDENRLGRSEIVRRLLMHSFKGWQA